jgi:hypothetical protein
VQTLHPLPRTIVFTHLRVKLHPFLSITPRGRPLVTLWDTMARWERLYHVAVARLFAACLYWPGLALNRVETPAASSHNRRSVSLEPETQLP